jgi:hypothetical protein
MAPDGGGTMESVNKESTKTLARPSLSDRLKAIEEEVAALRRDLATAESAAKVPPVSELASRMDEVRTLPDDEREARLRGEGRGMRALRASRG